jgi:protein SCO1/2
MRPLLIIVFLTALLVLRLNLGFGPGNASRSYGEARVGGVFTLTGTQGKDVSSGDFRGRLMLVYMGYSHCPDICPMTLSIMSDALKNLGTDADKVAAIFISLDPERDSPKVLSDYLASFDSRIIGLTGSKDDIAKVAMMYAAYFKKVEIPTTGSYLVDHSGLLYLMDRQGKYLTHFGPEVKAPELAKAIREHL